MTLSVKRSFNLSDPHKAFFGDKDLNSKNDPQEPFSGAVLLLRITVRKANLPDTP